MPVAAAVAVEVHRNPLVHEHLAAGRMPEAERVAELMAENRESGDGYGGGSAAGPARSSYP